MCNHAETCVLKGGLEGGKHTGLSDGWLVGGGTILLSSFLRRLKKNSYCEKCCLQCLASYTLL